MKEHLQQTAVVTEDVAPRDLPVARHRSGLTSRAQQAASRPCSEEVFARMGKPITSLVGKIWGMAVKSVDRRSDAWDHPPSGPLQEDSGELWLPVVWH